MPVRGQGPEAESRSRVAWWSPEHEHRREPEPGVWQHGVCVGPGGASSLPRLVRRLGLGRGGVRARGRVEALDFVNPAGKVGNPGEDTGVGGVLAVQAPAGQPHQNPGTGDGCLTDQWSPRVTLHGEGSW